MLSDEQIELLALNDEPEDWNDLGHRKTWREGYAVGYRSAESTATAPLLEQLAQRDKRIAELERKSDQDDETIAWQAQKISQHIDRIAELEEMNAQLREQNTAVDQACAEFERELEAEREDVQRFRNHALNEKDARMALELELEKINRVGSCGTVDNWLKLTDQQKRDWFAVTLARDTQQCKTIKQLEEELEDVRNDAERYRWLREYYSPEVQDRYMTDVDRGFYSDGELLDEAIDAAMKEQK